MTGTRRFRVPSGRNTSTASPRPTCSWWRTPGVPFASTASTNVEFIDATAPRPLTTAYAMKWVKETLAPLERARDSLSAARLISSRRAEIVRTLVAVGTARLAIMLATIFAAAPRSGVAAASIGAAAFTGAAAGAAATALGTVERWQSTKNSRQLADTDSGSARYVS